MTARTPSDQISRVLAWIRRRGILTVEWSGSDDVAVERTPGVPRLYIVAEDATAPQTWGVVEDWVRLPTDAIELEVRADNILARAAELGCLLTYVDEDGVLRTGDRITILSELQAKLVRILLEHDAQVVDRCDLIDALWPEGLPEGQRILDSHVSKTRKRLEGLPLQIHTVRGQGFLIERLTLPDPSRVPSDAPLRAGSALTLVGQRSDPAQGPIPPSPAPPLPRKVSGLRLAVLARPSARSDSR